MASLVLVLAFASLSSATFECGIKATCEEEILEELEREWRVDTQTHECRACSTIEIDAEVNCPQSGYYCDESFPLSTNVLDPPDYVGRSVGCGRPITCASLRCQAANATLVVGRKPVNTLRCKDRAWMTPSGEAASAVCARPCGKSVCSLPFEPRDNLQQMDVNPPDSQHPCAWGECANGAVAYDGREYFSFAGPASFACLGGGRWRYTGAVEDKKQFTKIACFTVSKCPSVPLAPFIPGYDTTTLEEHVGADGEQKYFCNAPQMLLALDGSTEPTTLTKTISCNPQSGIFVDEKGNPVGTKTFNCGTKCGKRCNQDPMNDSPGNNGYRAGLSDTTAEVNGCDVRTFIYTPKDYPDLNFNVVIYGPPFEKKFPNGGGSKPVTTKLTCNGDSWTYMGHVVTYIDDRDFSRPCEPNCQ